LYNKWYPSVKIEHGSDGKGNAAVLKGDGAVSVWAGTDWKSEAAMNSGKNKN
jgi:hypothetical protein